MNGIDDAPTVISTFAGCGGSSLGYKMAGYDVKLAVEWDDHAVECYRLNFPDTLVYHGDITNLSVEKCMGMAGLFKSGELDVLDGSPPCQGFSTAGRRQYHDARNNFFQEYARLLEGLQPRVFVMENVSGMVKGKMKLIFADVMKTLKRCGYMVSCRLLNAMYFGVPQSRQRVIFIGVREDLDVEPSHPKPQTRPITVREAWRDLKQTNADLAIPEQWGTNPHRAVSRYIPRIKPGGSCDDVHPKKAGYNLVRLQNETVAPTIPKTCNGSLFAGLLPPFGNRYCTIPELKRLGSFPDTFEFVGDFGERWARIGNSVPPLMMQAIAKHVRNEILNVATPQYQEPVA